MTRAPLKFSVSFTAIISTSNRILTRKKIRGADHCEKHRLGLREAGDEGNTVGVADPRSPRSTRRISKGVFIGGRLIFKFIDSEVM